MTGIKTTLMDARTKDRLTKATTVLEAPLLAFLHVETGCFIYLKKNVMIKILSLLMVVQTA